MRVQETGQVGEYIVNLSKEYFHLSPIIKLILWRTLLGNGLVWLKPDREKRRAREVIC